MERRPQLLRVYTTRSASPLRAPTPPRYEDAADPSPEPCNDTAMETDAKHGDGEFSNLLRRIPGTASPRGSESGDSAVSVDALEILRFTLPLSPKKCPGTVVKPKIQSSM